MGWLDGFPFVTKEERDRRAREFENRLLPYGLEEQRNCAKQTLKALFPDLDSVDSMFAFFDAKDAYTKNEKGATGRAAAEAKLKRLKWVDARMTKILLSYIELESEIHSLEQYPTPEEIIDRAFPEEAL
jgi:hypothetical protein